MNLLIDETYFQRWQGGRNYLKNLALALKMNKVILHRLNRRGKSDEIYDQYDFIQTEKYPNPYSFKRVAWKLFRSNTWMNLNPWINQIDVCFQVSNHDINSKKKVVRWIPDFQHVELPQYFSEDEIRIRNQAFESIVRESDLVLLSSKHAQSVFNSIYKNFQSKVRVLNFSVQIDIESIQYDRKILDVKYNLPKYYVHFPGQWWKHKNHKLIFEAISKSNVTVVFTGNLNDYRFPEYKKELEELIKQKNISSRCIVLGSIPYKDMLSIMYHANAVINPSLYEGWSTTIEEAKMLNKMIIASDILVNREQLYKYNSKILLPPNSIDEWAEHLTSSSSKTKTLLSRQEIEGRVQKELYQYGSKARSIFEELLEQK